MQYLKEYNRFKPIIDTIDRFFRGEGEAEQEWRRLSRDQRNSRPTDDTRPTNDDTEHARRRRMVIDDDTGQIRVLNDSPTETQVTSERSAEDILSDASISDEELNKIFQRAITANNIDLALELIEDPRIDPSLPYTERRQQNSSGSVKGVTDYAGAGKNGILNYAIKQNLIPVIEKLLRDDRVIANFEHVDRRHLKHPSFLQAAKSTFELESDEDVQQFISMMK